MRAPLQSTALSAAFIAMTTMAAPAAAQFNLESLVGGAVNAAAETVSNTLGGAIKGVSTVASAAGAATANTQWPASSNYKRYVYDQNVSVSKGSGKMRSGDVRYKDEASGKVYRDNAIAFDTLPLQNAIVRVHGNGERKIAVFADPTCPYSKSLERDINKLDNVTIYTIMAPILKGNMAKSKPLIDNIYCGETNQARAQAYDNYMLNGVEPVTVAGCPQVANGLLASIKGVTNYEGKAYSDFSPSIIFDNHIAIMGYIPIDEVKDIMTLKTEWVQ